MKKQNKTEEDIVVEAGRELGEWFTKWNDKLPRRAIYGILETLKFHAMYEAKQKQKRNEMIEALDEIDKKLNKLRKDTHKKMNEKFYSAWYLMSWTAIWIFAMGSMAFVTYLIMSWLLGGK